MTNIDEIVLANMVESDARLSVFVVIVLCFTILAGSIVVFLKKDKKAPTLANIKKKEGFDLYIGRKNKWLDLESSKWGNPYRMKNEGEREGVLKKYKEYVLASPELLDSLGELEGKVLGCYCYSSKEGKGKKCHGSVLIELFNDKFNK